jgi:hypothetical protein
MKHRLNIVLGVIALTVVGVPFTMAAIVAASIIGL